MYRRKRRKIPRLILASISRASSVNGCVVLNWAHVDFNHLLGLQGFQFYVPHFIEEEVVAEHLFLDGDNEIGLLCEAKVIPKPVDFFQIPSH